MACHLVGHDNPSRCGPFSAPRFCGDGISQTSLAGWPPKPTVPGGTQFGLAAVDRADCSSSHQDADGPGRMQPVQSPDFIVRGWTSTQDRMLQTRDETARNGRLALGRHPSLG